MKTLTYLAIWGAGGGGGFNNQTGPILVHIYPLFNNNLHVKYRVKTFWVKIKNMKKIIFFFFFFRGHVGPLSKIQGYQVYRNVCKCRPHHSGDLCTTRGKQFENQFFIYWPKCRKTMYILGNLGGPWGDLQWSDWACLAFQLSSHPYLCTCQIRKQSGQKFVGLKKL